MIYEEYKNKVKSCERFADHHKLTLHWANDDYFIVEDEDVCDYTVYDGIDEMYNAFFHNGSNCAESESCASCANYKCRCEGCISLVEDRYGRWICDETNELCESITNCAEYIR